MNLREWLVDQGFQTFADGLDEDFDTTEKLKGVTLKKILKLGGTDSDYARLIKAVNAACQTQELGEFPHGTQIIEHWPLSSRMHTSGYTSV